MVSVGGSVDLTSSIAFDGCTYFHLIAPSSAINQLMENEISLTWNNASYEISYNQSQSFQKIAEIDWRIECLSIWLDACG